MTRPISRKLTGVAAAIAALATLTAGTARAADTINCVFPFWFGFAPVFVADKNGYFAEEELTVTWAFDNDRANVLPALETGAVDCTMRTIGESMARPRTAETTGTIIGTIDISVGADGVVAGPGIETVEDLVGKTFAGEINHPGTVLTQFALSEIGKSVADLDIKLINTDDSIAVFEDDSIAAVATWEPMLSQIVKNTSREGSKVLLSSADYEGLITDIILVRTDDYQANREKYAKFLRGIYRAIDDYVEDPDAFIALSAPEFDVPPEEMKEALAGVKYTTYEETLDYMPASGDGKLRTVFDDFNKINLSLDLQDGPLDYAPYIDGSLLPDLFEGKTR
ncbi:ABC transporter substrate-binding protein [Actibacterium sp. 188UL27-1]|uniref:ABC transporter substrate-binding protein n=1 Tax=Actibacterium sp. 188UL27-1 TaxID=2786961 RepID=UPI00195970EC|nr:ABC transporter substrate-binding protein [Actibacterium sp. 188UL27-1]MBM7067203.1 ABC transporter substrate-binding protein [Actibacterium sp. 188UL27-1]